VGIPWGEPGNSEVGHTILGSGKIIYQNLPRITLSIQDKSFFVKPKLLESFKNIQEHNSSLHIMGLVGEGAVHSSMDHFYALLEMAATQKVKKLYIHLITDGRDSSPKVGADTISKIKGRLADIGVGKIATICGRNWTMDRNNNWDRIEKAYKMMVDGEGKKITDPVQYLEKSYDKNITDEYIEPGVIEEDGEPVGTVKDNDSIIFFNFREDRARQITKAFVVPEFKKIKKKNNPKVHFTTMTEYEKDLPVNVIFPSEKTVNGLGEVLSTHKKNQFRLAETEKYAHVTYFFNGGKEDAFPGEDRVLVPSPSVSKYDEEPEMSAAKVTQKALEALELKKYDFLLMNYANADMIGHTGNLEAAIEAVECVDKSLSILIPKVLKAGGCLLITADHGNAEEMKDPYSGQPITEHSSNPVPLWFVTGDNHRDKNESDIVTSKTNIHGLLSDIAPTVLDIMDIEKPAEMNGESLMDHLK
jgi:2,3-bisphosphoglycerate-independent phosphoglycerate mutase